LDIERIQAGLLDDLEQATIPLRSDVVARLREHMQNHPFATLNTPIFKCPPTIRIFDLNCQAAGIPKTDERGRVIDIHALRTTFGTHLAVAGVHPRVAQAALRHSRIELTMNLYTDPALLDVAGAVNALPDFVEGRSGAAQGRRTLREA